MGDVGREVRRLREAKGWSQPKLAVEAGVAVSGVSQIENGHRNPNSSTLMKLANALDVDVADFFPKAEAPLWSDESLAERREYPYPWMAGALARVIDDWRRIVEDPSKGQGFAKDPAYIRGISVACFDVAASVVLIESDTLASGEEWHRLPESEKRQRLRVAKQLDALAKQALAHYRASEAAQEAEVLEIERRREEIRRWTRELSA
jgi:transcriptional regulator with XRE-family HTH domain